MNGPQHYAEAEAILRGIDEDYSNSEIQAATAHAQAHATLALVAATVDAAGIDCWANDRGAGVTDWGKAVRKS